MNVPGHLRVTEDAGRSNNEEGEIKSTLLTIILRIPLVPNVVKALDFTQFL